MGERRWRHSRLVRALADGNYLRVVLTISRPARTTRAKIRVDAVLETDIAIIIRIKIDFHTLGQCGELVSQGWRQRSQRLRAVRAALDVFGEERQEAVDDRVLMFGISAENRDATIIDH